MPRQEKLPNLCRGRAVSGADSGAVLSLGRAQNGLVFESGSGGLSFFFSLSLSLLPLIGTDSDCDYKEGGGRITNRTGWQAERKWMVAMIMRKYLVAVVWR